MTTHQEPQVTGLTAVEWIRDAVDQVWEQAAFAHDRNWQGEPGISDVFKCQRQVGLRFSGAPPSDPPPAPGSQWQRQAQIGTWLHEVFLPLLAGILGARVIEAEVYVNGVKGHLDIAGNPYALDLKSVSTAKMSRTRSSGPTRQNRAQVNLYAKALIDQGHDVQWISLVYLDRENGDTHVVTEPVDHDLIDEALAWFHEAKTSPMPHHLPRGGRGPGLDLMCDDCPFKTECWPDGQHSIISESEFHDDAVEEILGMYREAADREKQAKQDKEFAAAILAGEKPGTYGKWRFKWRSTGRRLDQGKAKEILIEHGAEIPFGDESFYPNITAAPDPTEEKKRGRKRAPK